MNERLCLWRVFGHISIPFPACSPIAGKPTFRIKRRRRGRVVKRKLQPRKFMSLSYRPTADVDVRVEFAPEVQARKISAVPSICLGLILYPLWKRQEMTNNSRSWSSSSLFSKRLRLIRIWLLKDGFSRLFFIWRREGRCWFHKWSHLQCNLKEEMHRRKWIRFTSIALQIPWSVRRNHQSQHYGWSQLAWRTKENRPSYRRKLAKPSLHRVYVLASPNPTNPERKLTHSRVSFDYRTW